MNALHLEETVLTETIFTYTVGGLIVGVILCFLAILAMCRLTSLKRNSAIFHIVCLEVIAIPVFISLLVGSHAGRKKLDMIGDSFEITLTEKTLDVERQLAQGINIGPHNFIINNKLQEMEITEDTLFINEEIEQAYIVVEERHVKFKGFKDFEFDELDIKETEEANLKVVVKEIHY